MSDIENLKRLQATAKDAIKSLRQFADKKWTRPPTIAELEKLHAALPRGFSLAEAVDPITARLGDLITEIQKSRAEAFGKCVSEFVRGWRAKGAAPVETAEGWQIGEIQIALKPQTAQARTLYNREPLYPASGWAVITSTDDLEKVRATGTKLLSEVALLLPDDLLRQAFHDAYQVVMAQRKSSSKPHPDLVPIVDLHRAFRLQLLSHELDSQKADAALKFATLPRWVFLNALDRYARLSPDLEFKQRLTFHTGSQAEQSRGMGYTLGGLDPQHNYKLYCHVLLGS